MARLDSVLSFSHGPEEEPADQPTNVDPEAHDNRDSDDDAGFEFAFAPPLTAHQDGAQLAPADDLFAHGRILPAYPVFERSLRLRGDLDLTTAAPHHQASTAPPSPDTYCAWAPRSAPGSPTAAFPKSASTGEARRFRLRDLVTGGRSHSDGKEKFVFLQPPASPKTPGKTRTTMMAAGGDKQEGSTGNKASAQQQQKQSQKKKKGGSKQAVTEMDMATAHRLFYGKQGGALPGAAGERKQHSYLPYRTGIFGFFATAHALRPSHHPY